MKIKQRLKEPSTWAGLSALAMMFGVSVDPQTLQALQGLAYIIGGAAASAAVVLPEKSEGGK